MKLFSVNFAVSKTPNRIYWDACAWIAFINKEMPGAANSIATLRFEKCKEALRSAERTALFRCVYPLHNSDRESRKW